ncbi:MAG: flavodoxin domain-containing protein [Deltaproteobacteria bacterium]|nr:flavodoxin domain-containing protein [Deltaproteobacteria bacterium]
MHPIHVLFGTESNNSADLADRTGRALKGAGFSAVVVDMGDFAPEKLAEVRTLLIITSTYGNGDPPSNAEALHAWVMRKAPPMPHLRYAVCALGDRTYDYFCQAGKAFDARLAELEATRLTERQDCDVDYEKPYAAWLDRVLVALRELGARDATTTASVIPVEGPKIEHHEAAPGTRRNPVVARVLRTRRLSSPWSSKETIHVELSLGALPYEVGDSLGIWPENDATLVSAVLEAASCDPEAKVALRGVVHESSRGTGAMTLRQALATHVELAHVDARLIEATGAPAELVQDAHVLDVLREAERPITAQQLVDALRPIAPRQYSIASSLRAHPGEAHLTVDVVRFELRGRRAFGVASTQLADRAPPGAELPVYVHPAPHFRLPADDVPIVMIGPGTGIAPFRAFLEERRARGARGRSWLFFGARNAAHDFLYADELDALREHGVLTSLDTAFSRDQPQRVYVQDKMKAQARDLYAWIADGAVVYVCGDAKRMAPDVHGALAEILAEQGKTDLDTARARLQAMVDDGRYLRDVY